mmetsp:Transcript_17915/g.27692  ORF Transcript_17915/g.27692 Transcript_17915/m.27692 type:complete len:2216 (+) Transcript_17915:60-6707(+)
MSSRNAAALEGWVKSTDPRTGKDFFANHRTRKTQWDPPAGWVDEDALPPPPPLPPMNEPDKLPDNWEEMHDPSSGKTFYVDHARKITTWTRPTSAEGPEPPRQQPQKEVSAAQSVEDVFASIRSVTEQQSSMPKSSLYPAMSSSDQQPSALASAADFSYNDAVSAPAAAAAPRSQSYREESPAAYYNDVSSSTQYYHHSHHEEVDFSDSLPSLDFRVKKVADKLHMACPHCNDVFSMSKRRHHCRLCGDVFCDACSTNRATLPLDGSEFEKPVRICDICFQDVDRGNFFSMRRYLTPLQLFDPEKPDFDEEDGVATATNVSAALCALTSDLDSLLHNSSSFKEKVTIPPDVLVPAIVKHLEMSETSDRAIRALASLLALGSIVMNNDFAHTVYIRGGKQVLDAILALLERSGSDRRTLFVQEQAARAIFYLTESTVMTSLVTKLASGSSSDSRDAIGDMESMDIHRALRSMLDHVSVSKNPALQRWAAASIRNLITEDQRRTCLAINDVAAAIASGEEHDGMIAYDSFLPQLVSTGGVMILCSIIGADDADTRAHATGALSATIASTRAIDSSMTALSEMTGGRVGAVAEKDGDILRAIVSGGGCGSSLSQLLLSAENSVASMGCNFAATLVLPLLTDARGSATLSSDYDPRQDTSGLAACREAAIAIASGGCLPALISLVKDAELGGRITRPMDLKKCAMETLAAVVLAVGQIGKSIIGSSGKYEEALDTSTSPVASDVRDAIAALNGDGMVHVALGVLGSSSSQSLNSSRDTPSSRIREAAGIVLASMTSCSEEAIMELRSSGAISAMISAAGESGAASTSTLRGDGAPRCLGLIETASCILMYEWKRHSKSDGAASELLDRLLEAVDAGAIPTLSKVLTSKLDLDSQDKAVGGMKARDAACRILSAMFGIARSDKTGIGMERLYDAVDTDAYTYSRGGRDTPRNIVTTTLWMLQTGAQKAKEELMGGQKGAHYSAALMDLVEAALLAAGSMCGSCIAPDGGKGVLVKSDELVKAKTEETKQRELDVCKTACGVLVHGARQRQHVLPTLLVGGFGERSVDATMRLAIAIAQNGAMEQHAMLALSGILIPVNDMLKNSLTEGDLFKFSASLVLVRFCGPHIAAGEGNGLQSVREAIRVATSVLLLPVDPNASNKQLDTQESLKSECISTLEALSTNSSLWSSISKDALPAIISYLHSNCETGFENKTRRDARHAALRAMQHIIEVPSHAVAAAQGGLAVSAARLLTILARNNNKEEYEILVLALEVLHTIATNPDARREGRLLECGVVKSLCQVLGNAATDKPDQPTDSRANITLLGLNILQAILADVENSADMHLVLQSPAAKAYVDQVGNEFRFIRALCQTLLLRTNLVIPNSGKTPIPDLYGPQLVQVEEKCANFQNTHEACYAFLFSIGVFASAIDSKASGAFWKTVFLQDNSRVDDDAEKHKLAATFCAYFLSLLSDDNASLFVPLNPQKQHDYSTILRPLIRHKLVDGLRTNLAEVSNIDENDPYERSLLVGFRLPEICFSLLKDPELLGPVFELMKLMVSEYPDDILPLFVGSKSAILSLFEMLNMDIADHTDSDIAEDIRSTIANILGTLAEQGLLASAVERFDVSGSAIAALAAASLAEDNSDVVHHDDDDDDDEDRPSTGARLSSKCMQCLVELLPAEKGMMRLSSSEAEAIAGRLGKKMCQMVISRFLERAKLEQYELEEEEPIIDAPDVRMLCAVAQHDTALEILNSLGGLNALSLIAGEGELSALQAMQQVCRKDPSAVLNVDGHVSVMDIFSDERKYAPWRDSDESRRRVEKAAFDFLSNLCSASPKGRKAVSNSAHCEDCIEHASHVIADLVHVSEDGSVTKDTDNGDTEESSDEEAEDKTDVEDEEENSDSEEANDPAEDKEITNGNKNSTQKKICVSEDPSLEVAAYSFLTELVQTKKWRNVVLKDESLMDASAMVVSETTALSLQYATTAFLAKIAPFASSEANCAVSPTLLADIFHGVLKNKNGSKAMSSSTSTSDNLNLNLLHSVAVSGVEIVLDAVGADVQYALMKDISSRLTQLVESFTNKRNASTDASRAHGGVLACSLTLLVLLARGKDSVHDVLFNADLIKSMIRIVQWRYDSKFSQDDAADILSWKATVTHCLQFLSLVLRNQETQTKAGMSTEEIKGATLMIPRPGKAPRKTIDFMSALRKAIDDGDAAAANAVAAQRILDRIQLLN